MDLKTEAQLTQEISEVWRLLDAEQTAFSRIIAEKDKEIERLKAALNEIATTELICPEMKEKCEYMSDIALKALKEDSDVIGKHNMNDQEFIVMVKEMVLAPNTIMRLMEIIVKKDLEIRKFKEREKIRDEHIIEPLQKKLDE